MQGEQPSDPNIVMYRQQEEKYVGMGSAPAGDAAAAQGSTLEEPVIETVVTLCAMQKRDLRSVYLKIIYVFKLRGQDSDLIELRKNCTAMAKSRGSMGTTAHFPFHIGTDDNKHQRQQGIALHEPLCRHVARPLGDKLEFSSPWRQNVLLY